MGAGDLNRRIAVQVKTVSKDSTGQLIETWADSFFVWSKIITSGSGEFFASQKLYAQTTMVIKVRNTQRITVLNRIRYGSKTLEILGVNDENAAHEYLLLTCKEVA
jgi:SPP1 family predicted phage head-tail adaptor